MAFWTNLEMSSHGGGGASLPHSHSSPSGMYPTPSSPECRSLGKRLPVQVHFLDDSVASFNIQVSVHVFVECFLILLYLLCVIKCSNFQKLSNILVLEHYCHWFLTRSNNFLWCFHWEHSHLEFWVLFYEKRCLTHIFGI